MRRALALLLLSVTATASAADVHVTLIDGKLGARVDALSYPATLPRELTSGLTNRLYARVSVSDARMVLGQKVVEYAIRYDLWDQIFSMASTLDGVPAETRPLATRAELDAVLAALPLPRLFDAATLPAAAELTLRVEVLLNPIGREKMRMIRKWVAQNSTPEVGGDRGISMSNALFNRIFEQYADDSEVAAVWRSVVSSAPFRLERLKHDQQ